MLLTPEALKKLGSEIATRNQDVVLDDRTFMAFYGVSPVVMFDCWEHISFDKPKGCYPKHLLWTCFFVKLYLPEDVSAAVLNTSKNTFRKWVWIVLEKLALISTKVIDFHKRKRNLPNDVWCSISVDGTDFKVQEPYPFDKKWMSPKYKGSGLTSINNRFSLSLT